MADQPVPDFSQNQQFAPGFQPQQPIPGISSSFNPGQQQFSNIQQMNPMLQQQADQIAVQSMVTSRTTMALAQQNLMQSMHFAMMGTMGAFSDVTRRGGAMITSMSPAGRYNDMLAPNQNWALESSFRREVGYGFSNMLGLNPMTSPMSRMIQGRRPEFLTEAEYGTTMGYASQIRQAELTKGMQSIAGSGLMTMGASALGLGLGASIALPMIGGVVLDRFLEAQHAEHESLLRSQMTVRNKRVGIGQQYIDSREMEKVHSSFYEKDNPYASRFFGDNAIGRAFKPDIEKLKVFQSAADNGLLAFENLDAESIIKQITKISDTVEKFSRIGKVTREVSMKLMGELKGAGIHGDKLFADFGSAAITSSITGIDLQSLVGMKSDAARQGSYRGYDTFSASSGVENIISGYAMMQSNGMFKQKDISRLTQIRQQDNNRSPKDTMALLLRFGGDQNKLNEWLNRSGGGDGIAVGLENLPLMNLPQVDLMKAAVDTAYKKTGGGDWNTMLKSGWLNSVPEELRSSAQAYHLGFDKLADRQVMAEGYKRMTKNELRKISIQELGKGDTYESAHATFGTTVTDAYNHSINSWTGLKGPGGLGLKLFDSKWGSDNPYFQQIQKLKLNKNASMEEMNAFSAEVQKILPIGENGQFDNGAEDYIPALSTDNRFGVQARFDRRILQQRILDLANPEAAKIIRAGVRNNEMNTQLGGDLNWYKQKYFKDGEVGQDNSAKALQYVQRLTIDQKKKFEQFLKEEHANPHAVGEWNILDKIRTSDLAGKELEINATTNARDLEKRIYAIGTHIQDSYINYNANTNRFEAQLAKEAGVSVKSYREGYKPVAAFMSKYGLHGGEIADPEARKKFFNLEGQDADNEVSLDRKKEIAQLLRDKKLRPYLASDAVLGKTFAFEKVAKDLEKNVGFGDQLTGLLKQMDIVSELVPEGVQKQIAEASKGALDPAAAAIDKMNNILDKIYTQMGGKATPVPGVPEAKKESFADKWLPGLR